MPIIMIASGCADDDDYVCTGHDCRDHSDPREHRGRCCPSIFRRWIGATAALA